MKTLFSKENYSVVYEDRLQHLVAAANQADPKGYFLEFGVWEGESLSSLAKAFPERHFVGFDSFQGLPETWVRSFDGMRRSEQGAFKLEAPPIVPKNTSLVVGYFAETLPAWLKENSGVISFIHIDSDLYSSAKLILDLVVDRLHARSVLVFDELCDWNEQGAYQRWREGEALALCEWCEVTGINVAPLYRTNWIEGSIMVGD